MTRKSDYTEILIRHFKPSFEMLKKIVDYCPDNLWNKINGGFPFWQQIYHTLEGINYWFNDKDEYRIINFSKDVSPDLDIKSKDFLTKDEIKKYSNDIQNRIDDFLRKTNDKILLSKSNLTDKLTIMDIILMQIRHLQYHIGHCNSILRSNNIKPVEWLDYGE